MAQFNPNVPDSRDPNYLSYSRPISSPESNRTAEYEGNVAKYKGQAALHEGEADMYLGKAAQYTGQGLEALFKGIGDIFATGVKAADTYIKKNIDQDVYTMVDAERNAYTAELERAKEPGALPIGAMTGPALVDPKAVPKEGSMNILNAEAQPIPQGIEQGISRISQLVEARQNGKLSETPYIGNLNSVAKALRAQYPGHRDYIDSKIAEVTGMTPANAYVRSLVHDLNAAMAGTKNDRDKLVDNLISDLRKANSEGVYGANDVIDKVLEDGNISYGFKWLNQQNAER